MPYEEHPNITAVDPIRKVWRHIDFVKFVSLLEERSLYFSNVKNFQDDPYEGSITKIMKDKLKSTPAGEHNIMSMNHVRGLIYVSCWHLHEYESAAMWKQYASFGPGIAIQSTVQRMKNALKNTAERIHIGQVQYIDYNLHEFPNMNILLFALHKRLFFRADEELRMLALEPPLGLSGRLINIDLEQLIERIYLSPGSPKWFEELVRKTLDRYGIKKDIIPSEI